MSRQIVCMMGTAREWLGVDFIWPDRPQAKVSCDVLNHRSHLVLFFSSHFASWFCNFFLQVEVPKAAQMKVEPLSRGRVALLQSQMAQDIAAPAGQLGKKQISYITLKQGGKRSWTKTWTRAKCFRPAPWF